MAADRLELRFTKWDGRPHRRYSTRVLGPDEYGLWVVTDDQSVVTWGDGSRRRFPAIALTWIPPDAAWWTVSWTTDRDSDGSEPVDVYGNISAPSQRDNTGITLIDLDLDVVSSGDGSTGSWSITGECAATGRGRSSHSSPAKKDSSWVSPGRAAHPVNRRWPAVLAE